jgi:hypothetical protein
MSYLNKMYGRKSPDQTQSSSNKNPNRVTGGLRAQGVDRFTFEGEDGSTQEVPTQRYVQSLEDQLRKQRAAIDVLDRKLTRQDTTIQGLMNYRKN